MWKRDRGRKNVTDIKAGDRVEFLESCAQVRHRSSCESLDVKQDFRGRKTGASSSRLVTLFISYTSSCRWVVYSLTSSSSSTFSLSLSNFIATRLVSSLSHQRIFNWNSVYLWQTHFPQEGSKHVSLKWLFSLFKQEEEYIEELIIPDVILVICSFALFFPEIIIRICQRKHLIAFFSRTTPEILLKEKTDLILFWWSSPKHYPQFTIHVFYASRDDNAFESQRWRRMEF